MSQQVSQSAKGSQYQIDFKHAEWSETKSEKERSDYVWTHTKDGRILLSNSFCNEFQEQSLDILAKNTFSTVDELTVVQQDYLTFQNREAYRLQGRGKVDGVQVGLILLNTRRNNCYFDFVSITPMAPAKKSREDFENFLKAVKFK